MNDGYCLKTPHGQVVACTHGWDRRECKNHAITFLCTLEQKTIAWRWAYRHGYRIVPVKIVEVKP